MTRMTGAERRVALIDAAIAVMSRGGVADATTRSIVAEAGMQIGVFHYCFRSKEELMQEVMKTINDRSFEAVGEVLSTSADPAELIPRVIEAYWSHVQASPEEHQLTYELTHHALRHPGEKSAAQAQYDQYRRAIEGFLDAVGTIGGLTWRSRTDVLSRLVLAILEGVTFQWLVDRDGEMAQHILDELVHRLLHEAGLAVDA